MIVGAFTRPHHCHVFIRPFRCIKRLYVSLTPPVVVFDFCQSTVLSVLGCQPLYEALGYRRNWQYGTRRLTYCVTGICEDRQEIRFSFPSSRFMGYRKFLLSPFGKRSFLALRWLRKQAQQKCRYIDWIPEHRSASIDHWYKIKSNNLISSDCCVAKEINQDDN
jgi:hypothetical protein